MRFKLPRREKTKVKTYKQTVVNAVILVVVLALLAYVAIQISQNFSTQVSTLRTQMVTDLTYSYFDGCIFKDGETLTATADIVHYLVPDGAKVGVGQPFAEVYSGTSIAPSERAKVEQELNELSNRILMLESRIEGSHGTSDLGNIKGDIKNNYYAYIDSILSGDIADANISGDNLLGAMIDYSAITLSEEAKNTLSSLKSERAALIEKIGGTKTVLVSERSFTLYRDADGYESTLNSSIVSSLDRDTLDSLMTLEQSVTANSIGSAVYAAKWYMALPADEAAYETFRSGVGKTYEIEFLDSDGLSIKMTLEAVVTEEIATDSMTEESNEPDTSKTYLLFSSFDLARISGLERHQSVRIKLGSKTGYRIPVEALHTVGEDRGVYILVGNMIEFRRITIIGEGDGYYIVDTYERDFEDNLGSEIPYLYINDLIVTSGKDLYDGKLLD